MNPVREEYYKKIIRSALLQSYGRPGPQAEAMPCGDLSYHSFEGKMIDIMKAYKLESPQDWAQFYDAPVYKTPILRPIIDYPPKKK